MRFMSITLRRFGPFEDLTLDVSQGNHGLHLIYGDNEAGKTTALRGLGCFLFGFPHNISDDFRFKHSDQRVGATLQDQRGRVLEAVRRRGNKNTLRGTDDSTVLQEQQLQELLGTLSQDQFEMLFGLDHERLRQGGEAILSGQGGLGQALFEAGAGLAGLRRMDQGLLQQMEALYTSRGQKKLIALCRKKLDEERLQLRAKTLQIEAWTAQEETLRSALQRQKELESERDRNRAELTRLEAYRLALPVIDGLQDLQARLEEVKSARRLGPDFAQRHSIAVKDLHVAASEREMAQKEVERLKCELDEKPPQDAVLAEALAIERLKGDLGACVKAEKDRPDRYARMREHRGAARAILRTYFKSDALEAAESFRVTPAAQQRIRTLAQERLALLKAVEDDRTRITRFDHDMAEFRQHLAAVPEPADVMELATLARSLEQQGPLEENYRNEMAKLAGNRHKTEAALKRLAPCWSGSLEHAASLQVPSEETVRLFQKRFAERDEIARKLTAGIEQFEKAIRNCQRQIEGLLGAGRVPTEAQLREAREDRDAGLDHVRCSWLEGTVDAAAADAFIARHAGGKHLLDALAGSIDNCDDLADQMRRDAQRVSQLAVHELEKRGANQEREALIQQLKGHSQQSKELEQHWAEEWRGSGISPKSPTEMFGWLQQLAQVRDQIAELAVAAASVDSLGQHIESCKAKLQSTLGLGQHREPASLAHLLAAADQTVKSVQNLKRSREDLQKKLQDLQLAREQEEKKKERDEERLAQWHTAWGQAVSVIALGAGDDPMTAERYLEQHDKMFAELREAGTLEMRLSGIDRDRNQFLTSLTGLRRRLDGSAAPESTVATMEADVDALVSRLNAARQVDTQRKLLIGKLALAQKAQASAQERHVELEATLAGLRDEAGVACEDEIGAAIQQASDRLTLETRIEEERAKVRQQARGQPLEQFLAEALAAREGLENRLTELANKVGPLDQSINEQAIAAAAAKGQLDAWRQASADAAAALQESASLVEELRDHVEEYASLHLARQVLKLTIERFRQRNQGTLLERAAHFFRVLTNDAFTGLDVDENDKGEPILVCRRKTPLERVGTGGLSDGTRDQLFLALRLAGIEQHLQDREPMPLIVDDVLIHFDENRARATLQCLAELSGRTQVLLFTHHRYLVEMVRSADMGDRAFCHELKTAASE